MINNFLIINCIGQDNKIGLKVDNNFYVHTLDRKINNNDQLVASILNLVQKYKVNFNDSYESTIDTYKKKGYVVTLNYLKQLFNKNKITMTTKNQLVNVLTTIHMMDRKTRKRYFNGYVS